MHTYLLEGGENVDHTHCGRGVEPRQKVAKGDLVLRHEVVNHNLPLPQRLQLHGKEAWIEEEIKRLFPPSLPGHLEPTQ